jgi:ribosomal protein L37E
MEAWQLESVCRHCGAPMIRMRSGEWYLKSEVNQSREAESA